MHYVPWLQDLLRSYGLVESKYVSENQAQRRKRLTEHQRLRQLKREHELTENSRRKVLHLQEGLENSLSSDSDEDAGSSKKNKDYAEQDIDIQVLNIFVVQEFGSKDVYTQQITGLLKLG